MNETPARAGIGNEDGNEEFREDGVTDGTRTRNNQNHNLGLYR